MAETQKSLAQSWDALQNLKRQQIGRIRDVPVPVPVSVAALPEEPLLPKASGGRVQREECDCHFLLTAA